MRFFLRSSFALFIVAGVHAVAAAQTARAEQTASLAGSGEPFLTLPRAYNTSDSMARMPDGRIILAVPNYNNLTLREQGRASEEAPARLAIVDPIRKTVQDWYRFRPEDLSPATGKVAPMGVAFGPDGNLYYVDRQTPYRSGAYSRIGRIVVHDGMPVRNEVVVEGGIGTNDLAWQRNRLYVTDAAIRPGSDTRNTVSGVFMFTLDELQHGPVRIKRDPAREGAHDPHLIATFVSNGKAKTGADGIVFDDAGNLYIGVNEEGTIFRITLDANGRPAGKPVLFARAPDLLSTDGMAFDASRQRLYVADFLGNAVHAVDMDGNVTTLQRNGDADSTTGKLDMPCALLLIGDRLIVSNMDYVSAAPGRAVNVTLNRDHALTVLKVAQ
ncbi:SMP-30/gluconolactonase/LRE family protein [Paraburkholderia sp. 2C]|jgi:DNA-binding beta-propeller fold protein YncE